MVSIVCPASRVENELVSPLHAERSGNQSHVFHTKYQHRILLDMHVVNMDLILAGPTHSEVSLLIHPGDVLKFGSKSRRILRSGLSF